MRVRVVLLVGLLACAVVACALNPQPLPPDTADGGILTDTEAGAASDASKNPDAGLGIDSGAQDAAADASSDANDAAMDAKSDASDGALE